MSSQDIKLSLDCSGCVPSSCPVFLDIYPQGQPTSVSMADVNTYTYAHTLAVLRSGSGLNKSGPGLVVMRRQAQFIHTPFESDADQVEGSFEPITMLPITIRMR